MNPASNAQARVAITGVGGDVGLGAITGLRAGSRPCWILGLDNGEDCAGFHLSDAFERVKAVGHPDYMTELAALLIKHRIQLLICGVDAEVLLLASWRDRLQTMTGCRVVVGDHEAVATFSDKLDTARWLEQHRLDPPRTWASTLDGAAARIPPHAPLVAKPRRGNGSNGIEILRTAEAVADWLGTPRPDYCLQEYIDGPEYTCGLLFDADGGLRDWMAARRVLADGRTMLAEVVQEPAIDTYIQRFGRELQFIGALNLQLRVDPEGRPRVFEVNPRLSGSTSMRIAAGFNDPARILANLLFGEDIARADVKRVRAYRYYTQLVIPC